MPDNNIKIPPTEADKELKKLVSQERRAYATKQRQFKKLGKEFRYEEHGPGVAPDDIYNALRDPNDPKYKTSPQPVEAGLRKIADGDRVYPVRYFVIHHSVGPEFRDADHNTIAKWYSDVGKSRAYAGVAHSGHYFNGRETFASNHLVGHWHNNDWCIFHIIDDFWNNVSWGAGNWKINQQAINIENCGRFTAPADDRILRALARWWKPQHDRLGGNTSIVPHREVSLTGTACPERLGDQIPTIRSYLTNPAPTPPSPVYNFVEEVGKARVQGTDNEGLYYLDGPSTRANIKGIVNEGTIMDYVGYVTNGSNVNGSTKWWKNKFNSYFSEAYAKKVEAPAPTPPTPPTPTPPQPTPTPPTPGPVDPIAEFKKKWGVTDISPAKTVYAKEGAELYDFGANKTTGLRFATHHKIENIVGITAGGYYITKYSLEKLFTRGLHKDKTLDSLPTPPTPTPPTPTPPTPTPQKTYWDVKLDVDKKIEEFLKGQKYG